MAFLGIYPPAGSAHPVLMQNAAVVAFFILSGFLIALTTARRKADPRYGLRVFTADRFARIATPYLPALLLVAGIDWWSVTHFPERYPYAGARDFTSMIGNALMLQDHPLMEWLHRRVPTLIPSITSFGSARPLWTVAIEWWMYLFFGVLTLWNRLRIPRPALMLLLSLAAIVPVYNIGGRGNGLAFAWFSGAAAAWLWNGGWLRERGGSAAVLGGAALVQRLRVTEGDFYDPIVAALFAILLVAALHLVRAVPVSDSGWVARLVHRAAGFSFSLYLLHYSVLVALLAYEVKPSPGPSLLGGIVICNAIAYLFARATEFHYRRVRAAMRQRWAF